MTDAKSNSPKRSERLTTIGIIVVVGFLVVNFFINQLLVIQDYLSQDNWQTTTATVVKVNSKTHWLTYQYEIEDQTYIGTRLSITQDSKSELGIPDTDRDYPEGRELTIHYNPDNPSRAVIMLEADFSYVVVNLGLVALIVGGYFVARRLFRRYLSWIGRLLTGK